MADMYSIVKKQDEKIDDILKIAQENKDLLVGIDTRLASTPAPSQMAPQADSSPQKIQVELPDNVATNESIGKLIDEKLSATSSDGTLKKVMEQLPGSLSKGVADVLSDNLGDKVKDALYEGFHREFADERKKLYDVVNDMRYKAQSIIWGQWWRATPHWVYAIFAVLLIAAGGFGYGFFFQLNENSTLKDVEWLYRWSRIGKADTEEYQDFEHRMLDGKKEERNGMKTKIFNMERNAPQFLYFRPVDDWTPQPPEPHKAAEPEQSKSKTESKPKPLPHEQRSRLTPGEIDAIKKLRADPNIPEDAKPELPEGYE